MGVCAIWMLYFLITRSIGMGRSSMQVLVPCFAFTLTYWSSASALLVCRVSPPSPARLQPPFHSPWRRINLYLWYCRKVYQHAIFQVCELCKSRTFLFYGTLCLLVPSFVRDEVYYLVKAACGDDQAHYLPKAPHSRRARYCSS